LLDTSQSFCNFYKASQNGWLFYVIEQSKDWLLLVAVKSRSAVIKRAVFWPNWDYNFGRVYDGSAAKVPSSAVPPFSKIFLNRVPPSGSAVKKARRPRLTLGSNGDVPSAISFCARYAGVEDPAFSLKQSPCPHCGCRGSLNRHSRALGNDPLTTNGQLLRGRRVFCSNRGRRGGCGRTFSIVLADVLPRHTLTASLVWQWLVKLLAGLSVKAAAEKLRLPFALETVYRLRRSLRQGLDKVRTRLCREQSPPASGQAKGKVERFFRTVRDQFLARDLDLSSLEALNRQFTQWVEEQYNAQVHSILGMSPLDRYALDRKWVRFLPPNEANDELFFVEEERHVRADNTFSFKSLRFEVPRHLPDRTIHIRFQRSQPVSRVVVYYKGERMGEARLLNPVANDRKPLNPPPTEI
jgi:hypothetical protein